MISYFTAVSDLPTYRIRAGDTVSLNAANPEEPVMVHRPVLGAVASTITAWIQSGHLEPAIPSGGASVGPSLLASPDARPRLRLLPRDDQQTA
jgi:hypothetical protein